MDQRRITGRKVTGQPAWYDWHLMLRHLCGFVMVTMSALGGSVYSVGVLQMPTGWTEVTMQGMNGANLQAFIASPSGVAAVPLPNGWTSEYSYGINSAGQIVGQGGSLSIHSQAYIATASSITVIPISTGWSGSFVLL
jgi:hypothetical protein